MYWNLLVISLCLLLLLFLLWKEIKRFNKSTLIARLIASVIAVVSLACMVLPVSVKRRQAVNESSMAIILTEGYDKDSVQNILRRNKNAKIFTTDKAIKSLGATYIPSLDGFSEDSFVTKGVHVFGYGLAQNELEFLKNTGFIFHPGSINNKITSIGWTQRLTSGEEMRVQGTYKNASRFSAKIILRAFGTNQDSATLAPGQVSSFQLITLPKHIDKAVYTISVLSSGDTIETNPLPVEVEMTKPITILLLAASPDFENKFLKNWLAQNEYGLAVRTTISKNKYDRQYVNLAPVALDRITSSLLEKFDVVIADLNALKAMPGSDLGTLRSYVENKGLGLVVKADHAERSAAFYLQSFPMAEIRDSFRHTVNLSMGNSITSALRIEQPFYIQHVVGTQPLVKDQQMHILANSKLFGAGKIVVTTIPNTYSWSLAGNSNDYTSYWSVLLKKAAQKNTLNYVWKSGTSLPIKDKEVRLLVQTENVDIPKMQSGGEVIYPAENYVLPYEWAASYWPVKTGWQPLIYGDSATAWWYIYKTEDWQGVQAAEKMYWAKKYAGKLTTPLINSGAASVFFSIPKIYFFALFIFFSGFLWFEKKYISG